MRNMRKLAIVCSRLMLSSLPIVVTLLLYEWVHFWLALLFALIYQIYLCLLALYMLLMLSGLMIHPALRLFIVLKGCNSCTIFHARHRQCSLPEQRRITRPARTMEVAKQYRNPLSLIIQDLGETDGHMPPTPTPQLQMA